MEKFELKCLDCGDVIKFKTREEYEEFMRNNTFLFDGDDYFLCENCRDNYYVCEDCGSFVYYDESYTINDGRIVCENCVSNYNFCDNCNDYVDSDVHIAYRRGHSVDVCDDCRDSYFRHCDGCNELHHEDDLYWDDDDNCWCIDCYNNNAIGKYHATANRGFTKQLVDGEDENTMTFGAEIEVDYGNNKLDVAKYFRNNIPCGTDSDSSLDDGFEVVTQPFSWNWLLEHQEDFKKSFQYAIDNGWKSHDTSTCGQHIHVARPKDTRIIERIAFIMETYKDELVRFSRRNDNEWCQFYSDLYYAKRKDIKTIKGLSKIIDSNKDEHSRALNLQHSATLEFRIFRGTLNFETFMANIQLVKNITELCSDLNLDIKNITWDKLTQGEYVRPYVESKGIFTNKVPRDLTNDIIKYENKLSKICYRMLSKIIEYSTKLYNDSFTKVCNGSASYDEIIRFEKIRNAIKNDGEYINSIIRDLKRGYYNDSMSKIGYLDIHNVSPNVRHKIEKLSEQFKTIQKEYDELLSK